MSASTSSSVLHRVGDDPRAPDLSLLDAVTIFSRRRSPRHIVAMLTVFGIARAVVGVFAVWDLVLVVSILALHPLTEWVIHTGVLHWRPRRLGKLTVDMHLSSEHRNHHAAPYEERFWFIPVRSAVAGLVIVMVLGWLALPTVQLWLTLMVLTHAIGLGYEWTHYLCHTSYRPKGRVYKRIWRHHRLHHFKNEHYWMGVTMHLGDRILGTNPDPKSVETSPTCRDLHG